MVSPSIGRFSLFLASSPVQFCSTLAVIEHFQVNDAIILIEHNISASKDAMGAFASAALLKHPGLRLLHLRLERSAPPCRFPLLRAIRFLTYHKAQIDTVLKLELGIGLKDLGRHVHTVYFDFLHDYSSIVLDACRNSKRVLYPHGPILPMRQTVLDYPYLYRQRSLRTAIVWLRAQQAPLRLALTLIFMRLSRTVSSLLVFDGVDQVLTFRSNPPKILADLVVLPNLKAVLNWFCDLPEWATELKTWNSALPPCAVILLLPECNQQRIWEANRNFLSAHAELICRVTRYVGSTHVVIKAHPRSDASAAAWLLERLQESLPELTVEMLPGSLHRLPVEALAMSATMAAACSMGSCSLPSDIGIDVPHFVSPVASAIFDAGWVQPFWHNYEKGALMLMDEGICRNIDLCPAECAL